MAPGCRLCMAGWRPPWQRLPLALVCREAGGLCLDLPIGGSNGDRKYRLQARVSLAACGCCRRCSCRLCTTGAATASAASSAAAAAVPWSKREGCTGTQADRQLSRQATSFISLDPLFPPHTALWHTASLPAGPIRTHCWRTALLPLLPQPELDLHIRRNPGGKGLVVDLNELNGVVRLDRQHKATAKGGGAAAAGGGAAAVGAGPTPTAAA